MSELDIESAQEAQEGVAKQLELEAFVDEALEIEGIPDIYANGFVVAVSPNDVSLVLRRQKRAVCIVRTSHSLAKTLAINLATAIADLEETAGIDVLTSATMEAKIIAGRRRRAENV